MKNIIEIPDLMLVTKKNIIMFLIFLFDYSLVIIYHNIRYKSQKLENLTLFNLVKNY